MTDLADSSKEGSRQAADFLRRRFGAAPDHLHILIWSRRGKRSSWLPVGDLDKAGASLARLCSPGAGDVYAGVGLSPEDFGPENRCEAEAVAGITGLWADIDTRGPTHKRPNLPPTLDEARDLARSVGIPPTAEVFSGYGVQPYWEFTAPWIFDGDADRRKAADLARAVQALLRDKAKARGWALDSTHDLSRILRLPGTFNCKGEQPVRVQVLDAGGPRYEPGDFLALIPPGPRGAPGRAKAAGAVNGTAVAERARRYVAKMPEAIAGEHGHDATWAVAQVLVRGFEMSIEEARPILQEFNQRCKPPWTEKELEHKLASAREKSRLPAGYLLGGDRAAPRRAGPSRNGTSAHAGPAPANQDREHLTDLGNARRMVRRHGANLLHCHPWRKWLVWSQTHWRIDATAEATRAAKDTVVALWRAAGAEIERLTREAEEGDDA
jgi:hypothetical protein